jgi:hypothetical protein
LIGEHEDAAIRGQQAKADERLHGASVGR